MNASEKSLILQLEWISKLSSKDLSFLEEGGFTQRLYKARPDYRRRR